jgi:hypothetical protein
MRSQRSSCTTISDTRFPRWSAAIFQRRASRSSHRSTLRWNSLGRRPMPPLSRACANRVNVPHVPIPRVATARAESSIMWAATLCGDDLRRVHRWYSGLCRAMCTLPDADSSSAERPSTTRSSSAASAATCAHQLEPHTAPQRTTACRPQCSPTALRCTGLPYSRAHRFRVRYIRHRAQRQPGARPVHTRAHACMNSHTPSHNAGSAHTRHTRTRLHTTARRSGSGAEWTFGGHNNTTRDMHCCVRQWKVEWTSDMQTEKSSDQLVEYQVQHASCTV